MPVAPTSMTHSGIGAFPAMSPCITASLMPASGPTALATSFAPCAKLSNAAAKISGTVKSELTPSLSFVRLGATFATCRRISAHTAAATTIPRILAVKNPIGTMCFRPLRARYVVNDQPITAIRIGATRSAEASRSV